MPDDSRYVTLPDGRVGRFDAAATDDVIKAQILKDFPDAYGKAPAPPKLSGPTSPQPGLPISRFDQIVGGALNMADPRTGVSLGDALSGFQHYVNDPLDAAAKKAGQIGGEIMTAPPGEMATRKLTALGSAPRVLTPEERGRAQAIGETVGGTLGDIRNLPLMFEGGPILKKAMGAGFATMMGTNVVQEAGETGKVWDDNSPEGREARSKGLTGMVLGTGMAGLAGTGVRDNAKLEGSGPKSEAPKTDVETGKIQPEEMAPKVEPKPGKPSFDVQISEPKKLGDASIHRMSIQKDGEEVGHIMANVHPENPDVLQMSSVQLDPAEQGNGLGTQAYKEFINHAKESGFSTLRSDSIVSPAAARVWESLGKKGYDVKQVMEGLSGKQYELRLKPEEATPTGPRTYDTVQSEIDAYETRLEKAGTDPLKLSFSDSYKNVPMPEGRQVMPSALEALYKERDAIGAKDLSTDVGELSKKLAQVGLTAKESQRILDGYALDLNKSDVVAQYMAGTHAEKLLSQPAKTQLEKAYITLASERGIPMDNLDDLYKDARTTADAKKAIKAIRSYFVPEGNALPAPDIRPAQDVPVDLGAAANKSPEQHATDLISSLKAKETIAPERLSEVEKVTGVKLAGKEPNVQVHDLNNFRQTQVTIRGIESALTEKDPALSAHLPAIQDAIAKRFPDASASDRTGNYLSALSYLRKHIGDADRVEKAMDIATRKSEQGSLPGQRYDEAALKAMAQDHVGHVLEQYELVGDVRLAGDRVFDRITTPQFERAVADAKSPELTKRWEALKVRSAPPNLADPAEALFMDVQGQILTSGKVTEGIMRDYTGNLARDKEQLYTKLEKDISEWDSRSIADFGDFTDKMEHGDFASMSPRDQATAKTLRGLLDDRREKLQGLGTGKLETYIENYFPHLWVASDKAAKYFGNLLVSKRSLQGGSGFLKAREYDYLLDGLKSGLEPVTYNPIRMALLRIHEIDKYLMAHQIKGNLQVQGLARWFREGQAPVGWVKLDDRIFKPSVTETRHTALGEEKPTGGHTSYGQYYAPKDAARVINNYLSPGLGGNASYRAIRLYNNLVNSVNLGLSAFHAFEVSFNAGLSDLALVGDKIAGLRDPKGALQTLGRSLSIGGSILDHYFRGSHLLAEYMEPGRYHEMTRLAEALATAGGRARIDPAYRNNFAEAFRSARKQFEAAKGFATLAPAAKMVWRLQGRIIEAMSSLIMEHFVPRMKLGAFARMAQDALDKMGPDAPEALIRHELSKIWDSVDDRHGQVVYDNIFVNKIAKDLAFLGLRSPGWSGGTSRTIGGAVFLAKDASTGKMQFGGDIRNMIQQAMKGQKVDASRRLTYTLALPIYAAYVGSLIHYIHTGQAPQTVTDMFYPQDGKGNRIWFKTYMGDVINFARHPADTTLRKAAPWLSQAYEIYKNQDYYGQEIFSNDNPDTILDKTILDGTLAERAIDPQSWKEGAKYIGRSSQPFSISNYQQRIATGATIPQALESAAGILPAPKWVGQSAAEAYVNDQVLRTMSVGPKTAEEAEHMKTMRNLRDALTNGRMSEKDLYNMADQGKITVDDADNLSDELDAQETTRLERGFKQLPAHKALRAYELATPEERSRLEDMLVDKFESDKYEDKYKPEEVQQLDSRYMKALNLPVHDPDVKNNLKPAAH